MSTGPPPVLKQHTEEEWLAVKAAVEQLYLRDLRPLSTVAQTMESEYQFKASIAMYKRKLRAWGFRKNRQVKKQLLDAAAAASTTSTSASSSRANSSSPPRHFPAKEPLQTLFDLMGPWVAQAYQTWEPAADTNHVLCPPPARYIFDDFTQSIAAAVVAFESGDPAHGGSMLRLAFVYLERTLAPSARSVFTLHSLFFAVAILNEAGLFKVSRLLVAHATRLVFLSTQAGAGDSDSDGDGVHDRLRSGMQQAREDAKRRGYNSHPFPQIFLQLQLLIAELERDDKKMAHTFLLAWIAYRGTANRAKARVVESRAPKEGIWYAILKQQRYSTSLAGGTAGWISTMHPTIHCLNTLLRHSETDTGKESDVSLLLLDVVVSIYSFARHESFEETAFDLLARIDKRSRASSPADTSEGLMWRCATNLELAWYYHSNGDVGNTVEHIRRVLPRTYGSGWEDALRDAAERLARKNARSHE